MPAIRRAVGKVLKTKTKALDNGVIEVVVATNQKDRHGEILDIKGLDTKEYSGVVLWGHDYDSFPIGKSISLRKTNDGKLVSRAQLAVDEYDFAATAYKLIKNGYISDASIGFIPLEWDAETETWTKSAMVEYSFVSIGANPGAKVTAKALKEVGLTKVEFEEQVRQHMIAMKALKDDDQILDDEEEDLTVQLEPDSADPPEEETPPVVTPDPEDEIVDKTLPVGDNVRNHLNAVKSLISATERELDALEVQDTDSDDDKTKITRKRYVLVRSKKTLNSVDKIVELAIGELKKSLKEE